MPGRKDDVREDGRWVEKYTDDEFLDAIRALGGAGGTAEVAEETGAPQRTAYHRLKTLEEEGQVGSRDAGGSKLWTVAEGDDQRRSRENVITAVRQHLRRALDELPSGVPGRSAVEDAMAEIEREED